MRFHALACDYDGTVARDGRLTDDTRSALQRLRATGRKIILVTGREVEDLQRVCPDLTPFDVVVAENGAVLYWPASLELRTLVEPPPAVFADTLTARGALSISRGHVIVATWQPYEKVVLDVIRELGLEMQVIFNKGAVMVLPSGVNKGTGLRAVLKILRLSRHNVVGIGDAENDHALLKLIDAFVVIGASPEETLREFAEAIDATPPPLEATPLDGGEAYVWWPRRAPNVAQRFRTISPRIERRRHIRKYVEGDLPPERSFYFRGPQGKLNLRAQNLMSFLQLADGVDDETWRFHLKAGDYSRWLEGVIKDQALADEVAVIERTSVALSARETRRAVRAAIERRYTAAA